MWSVSISSGTNSYEGVSNLKTLGPFYRAKVKYSMEVGVKSSEHALLPALILRSA